MVEALATEKTERDKTKERLAGLISETTKYQIAYLQAGIELFKGYLDCSSKFLSVLSTDLQTEETAEGATQSNRLSTALENATRSYLDELGKLPKRVADKLAEDTPAGPGSDV